MLNTWLLDRIIKNSVSYFINSNVKLGPQKDRLNISMPFLGKSIDSVRKSIKEICKQFIPHKDVIIKPGRKVSNSFGVKNSTPFQMLSHVVYEYTCAECQPSYIGQTSRHLRDRLAEHREGD